MPVCLPLRLCDQSTNTLVAEGGGWHYNINVSRRGGNQKRWVQCFFFFFPAHSFEEVLTLEWTSQSDYTTSIGGVGKQKARARVSFLKLRHPL